ncbi:MAG: hypothetical protein K2J88_02320, partial [Oscillospiraceae bacterium]|nr:hypothetical protein [Oscillospiraceae bacterium]
FSLEGGVEPEENQWTADFELPVSQITGKMRAFAEVGNMIMKDGTVLLGTVQAKLVLELNPEHPVFEKLTALNGSDNEKVQKYAKLLYNQALLMENMPIDNPAEFSNLICELM